MLDQVAAIAAGDQHTCALRDDGSVWCWGKNFFGQLGDGTGTARATPMPVPGLVASKIALNGDFSCALSGGHYRCWGDNFFGQLGDGTTTNRRAPIVGEDDRCGGAPRGRPRPCVRAGRERRRQVLGR